MDYEDLKYQLNETIDRWAKSQPKVTVSEGPINIPVEVPKELPKDKRVVRTKTSGDRVYLIDEVAKTRAWITSGEILTSLGFDMDDVKEIDDMEMLKYNMASAIYKLDES